MSDTLQPPPLAELRAEIDRIDAEMHRLLMARGDIIDRLIMVKRTTESGSAFRPAREAAMMRRLVERHRGILPLDTAESIWRVIIATFTYVQAPFRVHVDLSAGEAAMRDSERFHFGFTVPLVGHMGAGGVVAHVGASKGDLGLVSATAGGSAWWSALEGDDAPKIIARLPFVERTDHPAGLPVFAIARPHPDAIIPEVTIFSLRVSGWGGSAARAASALADLIAIPEGAFDGAALLVSVPQGKTIDDITAALRGAGVSVRGQALVGSHATRYMVGADGARPVPTGR
ncbi:MAG TPA: chorismate mutase [Xanthobacteraceae bacterium]|nr:chorismate mutase [Xanthobacteraceae bacterium]